MNTIFGGVVIVAIPIAVLLLPFGFIFVFFIFPKTRRGQIFHDNHFPNVDRRFGKIMDWMARIYNVLIDLWALFLIRIVFPVVLLVGIIWLGNHLGGGLGIILAIIASLLVVIIVVLLRLLRKQRT